MPNWCNNRLEIHGDSEYLDKIEAAANSGDFFESIKPIGQWTYESAVNAWGTKWDINEAGVDRISPTEISITFDSAWSPPMGVYEALVERDEVNHVYATYFESGMGFTGIFDNGMEEFYEDIPELIKSGEITKDPALQALDEEYGFSEWYDEEPEALSEWITDGVRARSASHDV